MKKIYSVIVLAISLMILYPRVVLALDKPTVTFVGVSQSPLIQGDTETFYITSKDAKEVQYKVFLYEEKRNLWTELTSGYTDFVDAQVPYKLSPQKAFQLGKYKLSIWVRGKGSSSNYDSYYVAYLNCVNRDDNNRVYLNGDMQLNKEELMLGESIEIDGIENISGMQGPYKYKLHVYNATKNQWVTHITDYTEGKIKWQPTEAGVYVLDIWAMSSNSTVWSKVNQNSKAAAYEGWKLKVISVNKSNTSFTGYDFTLNEITDTQYSLKSSVVDVSGKWQVANREQIEYYLNPMNFLNGDGKYQFLRLNYTEGISAQELDLILNGKGILEGKGQAFLSACKTYNVSPAYLVSHAFLETGYGKSTLANGVIVTQVNGKPVTPKVTYNFFGIGAYDADPIRLGSEYAYTKGWFTGEQAAAGGAEWISKGYINNLIYNQNTLYKMRWNPNSTGTHQYATDIGWAYKQTKNIKTIMDQCTNANLYFDVPKYAY